MGTRGTGVAVAVGTAVGALGTGVAESRASVGTGIGVAVPSSVGVTGLGSALVRAVAVGDGFGAVAVPAGVAPLPAVTPSPEAAVDAAELAPPAGRDEVGDEE